MRDDRSGQPACSRRNLCLAGAGGRSTQQGVALIVSLILLIVVTLIGLAAVQGTSTQMRMTSNFYDRSLSFQAAEAGLAAGAAALTAGTTNIRNCGQGGTACKANPFEDAGASGNIVTVASGSTYASSGAVAGQPQYVIESMGSFVDPSTNTGFGETANAAQYGVQGASRTAIYYRVTARSRDPANTAFQDRAVVVLQAMYKQ